MSRAYSDGMVSGLAFRLFRRRKEREATLVLREPAFDGAGTGVVGYPDD
jgi:hypothetical protein